VLFSKILPFNKLSDRQFFLQRILLLAFLAHIILFGCMILFPIFFKKEDKFTILMHQAGATYVLMPLQKKIDQQNISRQHKNSSISKKSQVINYEDYLHKKQAQKGKKKFVQATKNSLKAKKSLNSKKDTINSLQKNSKSSMKLVSKSKATMIAASAKKQVKNKKNKKDKIKLMQEKKNYQKEMEAAAPVIDQKISESQELKTEEVQKDILLEHKQPIDQEQNVDTQQIQGQEESLDEVIFVGYEQFDECVISSKIQQSVVQNWTPPVGIDPGTACEMKVNISLQGAANSVEIIKSSGILVYDISARTALSQVEFPQEVYGKTIRIVLGS